MAATSQPRVQFVVSGKFIALFVIASGLLGSGYYWYLKQQKDQERFRTPPYFLSHGPSILRPCKSCLALGKLAPRPDWKIGQPTEMKASEQRWFLALEDPPAPVEVFGVLMLPVHPALQGNPAFGFDQNQVVLVLYQNLQRMTSIEQAAPTPAPDPVSSADRSQTPALKILRLNATHWRIEIPADEEWYETGIPLVASQKITIRPSIDKAYEAGDGHYLIGFGEFQYSIPEDTDSGGHAFELDLKEDLPFVSGPDWLGSLSLRVPKQSVPTFSLDVEIEFLELVNEGHFRTGPEPWHEHVQRHQQARLQAEARLKKP